MSHSDTIPLHASSQSDIDEIENLIHASVLSAPATVLPARPPSPPRIPVSSSPFIPSNLPPPPVANYQKPTPVPSAPPPPPPGSAGNGQLSSGTQNNAATGFGSPPNTLTEPVWDTVKRDLSRIVSNLKLVVFPNPYREDPGKALRDWDLWGPFFFIVFLGLTLSWSASVKKVLCAGHIVLGSCFWPSYARHSNYPGDDSGAGRDNKTLEKHGKLLLKEKLCHFLSFERKQTIERERLIERKRENEKKRERRGRGEFILEAEEVLATSWEHCRSTVSREFVHRDRNLS